MLDYNKYCINHAIFDINIKWCQNLFNQQRPNKNKRCFGCIEREDVLGYYCSLNLKL